MFFKRKNKNKISRKKRIEFYKGSQKRGLVFNVKNQTADNIPSQYANEHFGRPEKTFSIAYWKIFLFIFVLAGIVYVMLFSSLFKIKRIVVVNNQILLEGDIVGFLEERNIKNKNLFLLNSNQVKEVLQEYYKRIDDVRVYKVLPAKIKIKIKEKPSSIIWVTNDGRYLLDNNGFVIPGSGSDSSEILKMPMVIDQANIPVQDGDRVTTSEFIDFVNSVDESLKKRFGLGVDSYSISQTTFELRANINSGFYIVFDTTADIVEQLDKLARVYQQGEIIKEYVILSINGRVIIK